MRHKLQEVKNFEKGILNSRISRWLLTVNGVWPEWECYKLRPRIQRIQTYQAKLSLVQNLKLPSRQSRQMCTTLKINYWVARPPFCVFSHA